MYGKKGTEESRKKWKKTKLVSHFQHFKAAKNYITHLIKKARREYYTSLIEENNSNQGKLFRATKKLLSKQKMIN